MDAACTRTGGSFNAPRKAFAQTIVHANTRYYL